MNTFNKLLSLIVLVSLTLVLIRCNQTANSKEVKPNNTVIITGKIVNPKSNKVFITFPDKLYSAMGGDSTLSKDSLGENGEFKLVFEIKKPVFGNLKISSEYTNIYISPGDSLYITMNGDSLDETITYTGNGADENNYLAQKLLRSEGTMDMIEKYYWLDEEPFIKAIDSIYNANVKLLAGNGLSTEFTEAEKENLWYKRANDLLYYGAMGGYHQYALKMKKLEEDEGSKNNGNVIMKVINKDYDMNQAKNLNNPEYTDLLDTYFSSVLAASTMENKYDFDNKKSILDSVFTNEAVNSFMMTATLLEEIDFSGLSKEIANAVEEFKKLNPDQKDYILSLDETVEKWKPLMEGNPAPVFTYQNKEGNEVSLADFKGKVVYVDIWATWCGPCRAEAPHFQKLTEEFAGQDVVFLGVSIDEDKEAWIKYLDEKQPSSIQIFSTGNWGSDMAVSYNVNSIPRFLLIDQEGNIVSANADRPSGSIKEQIQELLSQNS